MLLLHCLLLVVQELLHLTGAAGIEYHIAWSAQNCTVMLMRLNAFIRMKQQQQQVEEQQRIVSDSSTGSMGTKRGRVGHVHFPWTGLRVVFTQDGSLRRAVDYAEGALRLDPSEVPIQWLAAMEAVQGPAVQQLAQFHREVEVLRRRCEDAVITWLANSLLKWKAQQEGGGGELNELDDELVNGIGVDLDVTVWLRQGFTCSHARFAAFLQNVEAELQCHSGSNGDSIAAQTQAYINARLGSTDTTQRVHVTAPASDSSAPTAASTAAPTAAFTSALKAAPVRVLVTVEDGHGSRLLNDGSLRLDCDASCGVIQALLAKHAQACATRSAEAVRELEQLRSLELSVAKRLQLSPDGGGGAAAVAARDVTVRAGAGQASIGEGHMESDAALHSLRAAAGVERDRYLRFLRQMDAHLATRQGRAALQHLRGQRLVAGLYLGVADDGSCILPWDFSLPV